MFGLTPSNRWPTPDAANFPNFLQFRSNGGNLGGPDADTVDFLGGIVTRGQGENANIITVVVSEDKELFSWIDVPGDYEISQFNINVGLSTSGSTGEQSIFLPTDIGDPSIDMANGTAVLVYQEGDAPARIIAPDGVVIRIRAAFAPVTAGKYAALTLLKRRANEWMICGDMAAAE